MSKTELPDIQNSCPDIKVKLNRVGIQGFKLPINILEKEGTKQSTIATIDAYVDLPCENRGVNMSRLPLVLHDYKEVTFNKNVLTEIAETIRAKCEADTSQVIYKFPYFITKQAPVSGHDGVVFYDVEFNLTKLQEMEYFTITVDVNATSCCPCSREISKFGAHNQRCLIKISVTPETGTWVWIEDLIRIAETSASCEIFSVLKRPDEAYVTETAYTNAGFVEDISRNVYEKMKDIPGLKFFNVEVASDESIHLHKAYSKLYV